MENDNRNLKFIKFHAENITSTKMYERILRKIERHSVVKVVRDTPTNFFGYYLSCIRP